MDRTGAVTAGRLFIVGMVLMGSALLSLGGLGANLMLNIRLLQCLETEACAITDELGALGTVVSEQFAILQNRQMFNEGLLLSSLKAQEEIGEGLCILSRDLDGIETDMAILNRGVGELRNRETEVDPSQETRVDALLESGERYFVDRQYSQAIPKMEEALRLDPGAQAARLYLAASLYRENPADSLRFARIKRELRRVLTADPSNSLALETLGELSFEEEEWSRAILIYSQLSAEYPNESSYRERIIYAARAADFLVKALPEIESLLAEESFHQNESAFLFSRVELEVLRETAEAELLKGDLQWR